jgi:hypothetical protein
LEPTDGRAKVLGFDTRTQAGDTRLRTGGLGITWLGVLLGAAARFRRDRLILD